jgi:hypothetical protein
MFGLLMMSAGCGRLRFDPRDDQSTVADSNRDFDIDGNLSLNDGKIITFPATGTDGESAADVAWTPQGNLVVAGVYESDIDFGAGVIAIESGATSDFYVAGFTPQGQLQFGVTGGARSSAVSRSIAVASNGEIYATGLSQGSFSRVGNGVTGARPKPYIVRLTSTGVPTATTTFADGLGDANSFGVAVSDGEVFIGGLYAQTINFGSGITQSATVDSGYVAAFDRSLRAGNRGWSRELIAQPEVSAITALDANSLGDVCAAGIFAVTVQVEGAGSLNANDGVDSIIVSFSSDGTVRWIRRVAGSGVQGIKDVAIAPNGDCVIVGSGFGPAITQPSLLGGYLGGSSDGFVARLSASTGQAMWAKSFGGVGRDALDGVAVDDQDRIVILGTFDDVATIDGSLALTLTPTFSNLSRNDAMIAGLAGDGTPIWIKQIAGAGSINANVLGLDVRKDGLYAAAALGFQGELVVGQERVTSTSAPVNAAIVLVDTQW